MEYSRANTNVENIKTVGIKSNFFLSIFFSLISPRPFVLCYYCYYTFFSLLAVVLVGVVCGGFRSVSFFSPSIRSRQSAAAPMMTVTRGLKWLCTPRDLSLCTPRYENKSIIADAIIRDYVYLNLSSRPRPPSLTPARTGTAGIACCNFVWHRLPSSYAHKYITGTVAQVRAQRIAPCCCVVTNAAVPFQSDLCYTRNVRTPKCSRLTWRSVAPAAWTRLPSLIQFFVVYLLICVFPFQQWYTRNRSPKS